MATVNNYQDAYDSAINDAAVWSNKTIRNHVARLREVSRNIEFKDFLTDSDKKWKERTAAAISAYEAVLKQREASDLELSGEVCVPDLCVMWKDWLALGAFHRLSDMLHGIMCCRVRTNSDCYATDDLIFLKELLVTLEDRK